MKMRGSGWIKTRRVEDRRCFGDQGRPRRPRGDNNRGNARDEMREVAKRMSRRRVEKKQKEKKKRKKEREKKKKKKKRALFNLIARKDSLLKFSRA